MKMLLAASICSLAGRIIAQRSDLNPIAEVETCSSLTCTNPNTSVCRTNTDRGNGVAVVPEILQIPSAVRNLSLTVIDAGPWGSMWPYQFTTRTLFVGAPPELDLTRQPPACALLLQYQGQTFPSFGSLYPRNTTICPDGLKGVSDVGCLDGFADTIRDFEYPIDGLLPRCQALAEHVEHVIQQQLNFCSYYSSLVSVYGGAISGPDSMGPHSEFTEDEGCKPILPSSHQLRNVTSAVQVLHSNSSADELTDMGGRTGVTPIIGVTYEDEQDSDPQIRFLCVRTLSPDGYELPFQQLNYDSLDARGTVSAGTRGNAGCLIRLLAAVAIATLL